MTPQKILATMSLKRIVGIAIIVFMATVLWLFVAAISQRGEASDPALAKTLRQSSGSSIMQ